MDHLADVKKYAAKPDEAAVAGMAKAYALVMSKPDTKWVAASDPDEIQRVVDNFLKKKLGRKEKDADLTKACEAVAAKMKDTRNKSRLVFYYLLPSITDSCAVPSEGEVIGGRRPGARAARPAHRHCGKRLRGGQRAASRLERDHAPVS